MVQEFLPKIPSYRLLLWSNKQRQVLTLKEMRRF
jgi:hypothetical protein